jgi:hypothetical protein
MGHETIHTSVDKPASLTSQNGRSTERRWERRVYGVLWGLALACLVLAVLVWWRLLLNSLP